MKETACSRAPPLKAHLSNNPIGTCSIRRVLFILFAKEKKFEEHKDAAPGHFDAAGGIPVYELPGRAGGICRGL